MNQRQQMQDKIRNIKLLILDVDGVLTRGEIIYTSSGQELKSFNVKDGLGVFLFNKAGLVSVILTARKSKVLKRRAKDMGVKKIYCGLPKEKVFEKILKDFNITEQEACFVGDDLIDIKVAERAGFSVAVADAAQELKNVCDYITQNRGGEGAVREVIEVILRAKGLWKPYALGL
jgi:3-deoxy-D-manno-octulosonate 8-phosphate phosphatase (KDO 8-P phosphatase)